MHITFLLLQHDHLPSYTESRAGKLPPTLIPADTAWWLKANFMSVALKKNTSFSPFFCLFVHLGKFPWHFALFLYFTQGSKTHLWKKIFSFPQLQSVGNWPLKSLIHFKIVCQTFLVAISVGKIQYLDKSSTIPFAACALQRKRDTLGYSENSRLLPQKLLFYSLLMNFNFEVVKSRFFYKRGFRRKAGGIYHGNLTLG